MRAPLRLLHTADWQLGKQYSQFAPDDAAALSAARFAVVDRIAEMASTHAVELVLVAGDVFDVHDIGDTALRRAFNALKKFECAVLLLPGNHDADIVGGVFDRAKRLNIVPSHVYILANGAPLDLLDGRVRVFSAPLRYRHEPNLDLKVWANFPTDAATWRVGIAHGSVLGVLPEHYELHNVIDPGDVEHAALDYLALGDWHGALQVNARCAYSGTPEPDRFRDNHAGYIFLVDLLEGHQPKLTSLTSKSFSWHRVAIEFNALSDVEALEPLSQFGAQDVVAIKLSGTLGAELERQLRTTLDALRARVRALQLNDDDLRFLPSEAELESVLSRARDQELASVMPELLIQLHAQAREGEQAAMDALRLVMQWQQEQL